MSEDNMSHTMQNQTIIIDFHTVITNQNYNVWFQKSFVCHKKHPQNKKRFGTIMQIITGRVPKPEPKRVHLCRNRNRIRNTVPALGKKK
jgi:hypothetical protein